MGTAATRAKNKWNDENLDHYHLTLQKGKKEEYMKKARELKYENLSKLIVAALEEKIEKEERMASAEGKKTMSVRGVHA